MIESQRERIVAQKKADELGNLDAAVAKAQGWRSEIYLRNVIYRDSRGYIKYNVHEYFPTRAMKQAMELLIKYKVNLTYCSVSNEWWASAGDGVNVSGLQNKVT